MMLLIRHGARKQQIVVVNFNVGVAEALSVGGHQPALHVAISVAVIHDFAGMSHDLGVLYQLGSKLANSRQWPNWASDSEFRATRDATAGDRK